MIRRLTAVAIPVVLLAGIVAVVRHGEDGPGVAQARLVVDGSAVVVRADGPEERVTDEAVVDFGDSVRVTDGTAVVELATGARYELRHRGGTGSELVVADPPELLGGDALVAEGFPAAIRVGTATLRAQGPLEVRAGEESAASYGGGAGVAGVGDVATLPALRQLVLVSGAMPEPIRFDGTDPWDRRFLGEAIAFGEQLEALARGYTSDLPPGGGRTEGFFRSVVPALAGEREFGEDLLDPARPPGETLVGAAIAVQGRRGEFRERWSAVFAFRAAGAAWGIVALDQGVSSAPVLETIELAIDGPDPTTTTTRPRARSGATSTTTSTTSPPSGPTTAPPSPPPTAPEQPPGLLDPVTDPAGGAVEGLLDGILGDP